MANGHWWRRPSLTKLSTNEQRPHRLRHVTIIIVRGFKVEREEVRLSCNYGCLGDQLCFMVAARYFARAHPDNRIVISNFPDLLRAYGDNLVCSGEGSGGLQCNPELRHRVKNWSPCRNYLGTYLAELGLPCDPAPTMELPPLDPVEGLAPKQYVCVQPYSGFCGVPQNQGVFFASLIETVRRFVPDWPVVAVGLPDTPREIPGVNFDHLGSHATMLSCIQHSALVLSARSASAHIASAYRVPGFIWMPSDGEEWHLNYPEWPHVRIGMNDDMDRTRQALASLLRAVLKRDPALLRKFWIDEGTPHGTVKNEV